jgi:hypothetical protein
MQGLILLSGGMMMDDFERMLKEAEKFSRQNLDKKKVQIDREVENYEFKTLLDAVELLFELRAKREKKEKDKELIKILEGLLREEPFEYADEDFILISYKNYFDDEIKNKKR